MGGDSKQTDATSAEPLQQQLSLSLSLCPFGSVTGNKCFLKNYLGVRQPGASEGEGGRGGGGVFLG